MSNCKYPWDRWLKRKRKFKLKRGVDYDCMTHAMAVAVRKAATRHDVSVSVGIGEDYLTVKVQR